mgnify:CR=1 FL=1
MTRLDRRYWRYVISRRGVVRAKELFADRLSTAKGRRKIALIRVYKEVFYEV